MRKTLCLLLFSFLFLFITSKQIFAQQPVEVLLPGLESTEATISMSATNSAQEATPSSIVTKVIEKKSDLTETAGATKGKLERFLMEQKLGPLSVTNFLRWAIRNAVNQGVPANTIVLLLLFPIIAAIIASARHIVGIRSFGIFTPAIISVAFLATGIVAGLLLFGTILVVATFSRVILRRFKLQYLPRMAFLFWFVSIGVLAVIFASPFLSQPNLTTVTIFPILIMILLAEDFIDLQSGGSMREAIKVTAETLLMALFCFLVMNLEFVQKFILINPELTVLGVAVYDIFIGKYVGLRIMEYWRFREIIKNG